MNAIKNAIKENRKYKVFWGVFIVSTGLLITELITADHWVKVVIGVVTAYMAGNVGEHFSRWNHRSDHE